MKPLKLAVMASALLAASAASQAGVTVGFGFAYGPAPYYYPYAPRPYYAPVYYPRYYYPRYYRPRYYYPWPVYGVGVYPYAPPVASYPPRYAYAQPVPPKSTPPVAAIPPKTFEKVTLSAKELFGFDQYQLQGSVPKLDEIAKALKENPGIASVTIAGYTDRLGTDEYNMALSKRRAESVRFYLMRQGVDGKRLEVVAKGEANPIVDCHQKDLDALIKCLEPNRRIEIEPFAVEKKTATS